MTEPKKTVKRKTKKTEKLVKKPVKKTVAKKASPKKKVAIRRVKKVSTTPKPIPKAKPKLVSSVVPPEEKAKPVPPVVPPEDKAKIVSSAVSSALPYEEKAKPVPLVVPPEDKAKIVSSAVSSALPYEEKAKPVPPVVPPEEKAKPVSPVVPPEEIFPARHKISVYKKIAFSFIALTAVLILVILYFTVIKVSIVLVPNQERVSNSMIFDVRDADVEGTDSGDKVSGIVKKVAISHGGTYAATGEEVIGKEAIGVATIINNYNKNQPLVATTRLLTADGKLFRLKNTVNVPAGDSVVVDIYADDPSPEMAIAPTKFTIPGLWAGMQDDIYAESSEAIVYRQKVKKYVKEEDIESATRDMKQQLLVDAKEDINENFSDYSQIKYKIDENSIKSEVAAQVDDEVDEFSAEMTADVVVVAFDGQAAADLAKQKFLSAMSKNKELISFDPKSIIYALNTFNVDTGLASLNATFEGKVSLKSSVEVVDLEKIRGINRSQLDVYLSEINDIAGYEIKFSPGFLPAFMQKVPHLIDRITVEMKR